MTDNMKIMKKYSRQESSDSRNKGSIVSRNGWILEMNFSALESHWKCPGSSEFERTPNCTTHWYRRSLGETWNGLGRINFIIYEQFFEAYRYHMNLSRAQSEMAHCVLWKITSEENIFWFYSLSMNSKLNQFGSIKLTIKWLKIWHSKNHLFNSMASGMIVA